MPMGAHVDWHVVERDVDIGAVIEIEAAQVALPPPLCCVTISPGTTSSTSPTRYLGCSWIYWPLTTPCEAVSGTKNARSAWADTLTSGNVIEVSPSGALAAPAPESSPRAADVSLIETISDSHVVRMMSIWKDHTAYWAGGE
jgi:hypothetical protein